MLLRTELRMLLRAPWRTALLCVLLAAAVGAASLGGGLLAASDAGMAEIAEKYTTIAVFTKQAESDWKVLRKLKELAEQTEHGAMDRRVFCGGYWPGVHTATSLKETWALEVNSQISSDQDFKDMEKTTPFIFLGQKSDFDAEYSGIALIATCLKKIKGSNEDLLKEAAEQTKETGEWLFGVDEVLYAHEDYEVPKTMLHRYYDYGQGDSTAHLYETGKKYLIIGDIIFNDYPSKPSFNTNGSGTRDSNTGEYNFTFDCIEMAETLEKTLVGLDGERMRERLHEVDITLNSVSVISTQKLNSILQFNRGNLYITEGRDFTVQEHADVAPVCIMSVELAQLNGLSIGDTVPISLYPASYIKGNIDKPEDNSWFRFGYESKYSDLQKERKYTIVGLFNTPEWQHYAENKDITFSPNTIFIPANPREELVNIYMPTTMYAAIIDNGHAEEFLAEMEELEPGSSEYFVIYDQGYSEVAPTIEAFTKNARFVAMGCAAVFVLAAGVFLAFAAAKNRHDLGVMRSLGATKARTEGAFLLRCGMPAVAGGVLGALAGQALFGRAVAVLGAEELISRPAGTLWIIAAGCTAAVICLTALAGAVLVNKKPQALMREKE